MSDMPFESIDAFKGSMSQQHIADPTDYERSNYIQILENKQSGRQTKVAYNVNENAYDPLCGC